MPTLRFIRGWEVSRRYRRGIDWLQEFELMKVRVARVNLFDSMFPHQYCRVSIVENASPKLRHFQENLTRNQSVLLGGRQDAESRGVEKHVEVLPRFCE